VRLAVTVPGSISSTWARSTQPTAAGVAQLLNRNSVRSFRTARSCCGSAGQSTHLSQHSGARALRPQRAFRRRPSHPIGRLRPSVSGHEHAGTSVSRWYGSGRAPKRAALPATARRAGGNTNLSNPALPLPPAVGQRRCPNNKQEQKKAFNCFRLAGRGVLKGQLSGVIA